MERYFFAENYVTAGFLTFQFTRAEEITGNVHFVCFAPRTCCFSRFSAQAGTDRSLSLSPTKFIEYPVYNASTTTGCTFHLFPRSHHLHFSPRFTSQRSRELGRNHILSLSSFCSRMEDKKKRKEYFNEPQVFIPFSGLCHPIH